MLIELLTGLHPFAAREIVDDTLFEQMADLIRAHHDDAVAAADLPLAMASYPSTPQCEWRLKPLQELSTVAAKCVRTQASHRTTIRDVLPSLEEAIGGS